MEDFITINELARILGISRQAMLKQLKGKIYSGEIESQTKGKTLLLKFSTLPQEIIDRYQDSRKEAVKEAKNLIKKPQKDINFEKELWAAADRLRGNIDPSEYKYIVLGLIFLKYVSDSFYQQREKLQKSMSNFSDKKQHP